MASGKAVEVGLPNALLQDPNSKFSHHVSKNQWSFTKHCAMLLHLYDNKWIFWNISWLFYQIQSISLFHHSHLSILQSFCAPITLQRVLCFWLKIHLTWWSPVTYTKSISEIHFCAFSLKSIRQQVGCNGWAFPN